MDYEESPNVTSAGRLRTKALAAPPAVVVPRLGLSPASATSAERANSAGSSPVSPVRPDSRHAASVCYLVFTPFEAHPADYPVTHWAGEPAPVQTDPREIHLTRFAAIPRPAAVVLPGPGSLALLRRRRTHRDSESPEFPRVQGSGRDQLNRGGRNDS